MRVLQLSVLLLSLCMAMHSLTFELNIACAWHAFPDIPLEHSLRMAMYYLTFPMNIPCAWPCIT